MGSRGIMTGTATTHEQRSNTTRADGHTWGQLTACAVLTGRGAQHFRAYSERLGGPGV
jgi:hypothetical protein